MPNSAFSGLMYQRLPSHDSGVISGKGVAGAGGCCVSVGMVVVTAVEPLYLSRLHHRGRLFELGRGQSKAVDLSVLAQETGGYLSSVCPLWEEEGKAGWTREKTVTGAVRSAVGWAPALSGPSENPAPLLTGRVEERSRRGDHRKKTASSRFDCRPNGSLPLPSPLGLITEAAS